ncbi:hypothetical protein, partial [Streptomyces sp. P17]|uniref:hypothetical protein n=1 Tax=Streptomyces sp. P17 TaxID=3074716 RepID=UPI0028F423A6
MMGLAGTRIQDRPGGLSVLTTLLVANLQGLGLFHALHQSKFRLDNKLRLSGTTTTIPWRELPKCDAFNFRAWCGWVMAFQRKKPAAIG